MRQDASQGRQALQPLAGTTSSGPGIDDSGLTQRFDGVVMLTWSDWWREPRSNRYHYASRFARRLPVLFVQPDGPVDCYSIEETDTSGVTIVHVPPISDDPAAALRQSEQLALALLRLGIRRPLLWIYNPHMEDFVRRCYAPLKVYHATEDYFETERLQLCHELHQKIRRVLQQCDLVIAVSDGVAESYRQNGHFHGPIHVATNGCDFEYYAKIQQQVGLPAPHTRIALYQGGINWRLDFELLDDLATLLPDWEIHICGLEAFNPCDEGIQQRWQALQRRPNVRFLGYLNAEDTARAMLRSTVGLIPFVKERAIIERSMPLKAYEYVACGLPVISVPIRQLAGTPELFSPAGSAPAFAEQIKRVYASRWHEPSLRLRSERAAQRSYEAEFMKVCNRLVEMSGKRPPSRDRLNVLILYDAVTLTASQAQEQLQTVEHQSRLNVFYLPIYRNSSIYPPMALFDVLLVHDRLLDGMEGHLSAAIAEQIRRTPCCKLLFAASSRTFVSADEGHYRDLGLQGEPFIRSELTAADGSLTGAPSWLAILQQLVPRSQGFILNTMLVAYQSPCTGRWHSLTSDPDQCPNGTATNVPCPAPSTWEVNNVTGKGLVTTVGIARGWLRQVLRPASRLLRGLLHKRSDASNRDAA